MFFNKTDLITLDINTNTDYGSFPGSSSGFFAEVRGYNKTQIEKSFEGQISLDDSMDIERLHAEYINNLRSIGIRIPNTKLFFDKEADHRGSEKYSARILQERFEPHELVKNLIKNAEKDLAINLALMVVQDTLKFLASSEVGRIGFHPTLRNYAFREGEIWYIDTFPPLLDKERTVKYIMQHAPTLSAKILGVLCTGSFRISAKEYYDSDKMLRGIARSFYRLRPELFEDFKVKFQTLLEKSALDESTLKTINLKLRDGFKEPVYKKFAGIFRRKHTYYK